MGLVKSSRKLSWVRTKICVGQYAACTSGRAGLTPLGSHLFSARGLFEIDTVALCLVTVFGFCFHELACSHHVNIGDPNALQQGVPPKNRINDNSLGLLGACCLHSMPPCSYIKRDSEQLTSLQVSHYFAHL